MSKVLKHPPESRQELGLPGPPAPKRRRKAKSKRFSPIRKKTTRTDAAWKRFTTNTRHDLIDRLNTLWPDELANDEPRSEEFREGYFQGVMDALSLTRAQTQGIIAGPKADEKMVVKQEVDFEDVYNSVVSDVKIKSEPSIKQENGHEDIEKMAGDGGVSAVSMKLEPVHYVEDNDAVQKKIKIENLQDESGSARSGVLSRLGKWFWYT